VCSLTLKQFLCSLLLPDTIESGGRRADVATLKVSDIDSRHMVVHIQAGKGRKDSYARNSGAHSDHLVNERSLWITSRRAPLRVAQASELRAIARLWNTTELLTC
jgi:integrase